MPFTMNAVKMSRVAIAALGILCMTIGPAAAQWLKVTLPGIPRGADGKPNLMAPAPKTPDGKPDLSGIWHADSNRYMGNLAGEGVEVPMHPWAAALYKERQDNFRRDKPQVHCLPHGVPDAMALSAYPFKIVQTPGVLVVLYEEMNTYRQIHTDGRSLPVDPEPAWYGFSIGKWERDTFVVETSGFKEGTWLDNGGHPHTDALHTIERFRRSNFGSMEMDVAIDDPKAYLKPWKAATLHFELLPDTELIENLCNENNRDAELLAGDKQ